MVLLLCRPVDRPPRSRPPFRRSTEGLSGALVIAPLFVCLVDRLTSRLPVSTGGRHPSGHRSRDDGRRTRPRGRRERQRPQGTLQSHPGPHTEGDQRTHTEGRPGPGGLTRSLKSLPVGLVLLEVSTGHPSPSQGLCPLPHGGRTPVYRRRVGTPRHCRPVLPQS